MMITALCTKWSVREEDRAAFFFSPDFFNIYSEIILRKTKHHEGVGVGDQNMNSLRYAVLIADSKDKLQNILTTATVQS